MIEKLRQQLREAERFDGKKSSPEQLARFDELMMAQSGWVALTAWVDMPLSGILSPAGASLAGVGLDLARSHGFGKEALAAAALLALRQDKAPALGWLMDQGFDPRASPAPPGGRGHYHESWGRNGGDPQGWLNAAIGNGAYQCARLMADRGALAREAPPSASAMGESAAAPMKKVRGKLKKADLWMESLEESMEAVRESEGASLISMEASRLRESSPLFVLFSGRMENAPAGLEAELLEPKFGLGIDTASPAFRLALAREAADGEERVISMAQRFGVAPDEGGELAEEALNRCVSHLMWAMGAASSESKKEERYRKACAAKMLGWFEGSGAFTRLEASGRSLSDRALDKLAGVAEDCFESRSEESAAMAMNSVRNNFANLFPGAGVGGKGKMPAPSEGAAKAVVERVTGLLLEAVDSKPRGANGQEHHAKLRSRAQEWIKEISTLIPESGRAPKRVLKI